MRRLHVEPAGGSFEVVADVTDPDAAEGRADFALFGGSDLAVSRYMGWAAPWWIGGAVLLAGSLVLLCLAVYWRGESVLDASLGE